MLATGRVKLNSLAVAAIALLAGGVHAQTNVVDPASSRLPNPNPTVITGWADLPDGRTWGSTAGIDIGRTRTYGPMTAVALSPLLVVARPRRWIPFSS